MSLNNKVLLTGHLGKDPEIKQTPHGIKFANFTIATNDSYKDKDGNKKEVTDWHNLQFYGPIVDVISKYVKKGSKISIEGKLKNRSWEKDGVKQYTTYVQCTELLMHSSNSQNGEQESKPNKSEEEENDLPF